MDQYYYDSAFNFDYHIDIICDGPVAQSLGVEARDPTLRRQSPRKRDESIITRLLIGRVFFSASIIVLGTLAVFLGEVDKNGDVSPKGRTMVNILFENLKRRHRHSLV